MRRWLDKEIAMKIRLFMVGLLVGLGLILWWSTSQAQGGEEACKAECQAQHERCIEACGRGRDPVECEASCRDEAYACSERCE